MKYILNILFILLISLILLDYTNNYGYDSTILKVEQNNLNKNLQSLNIKLISLNKIDSATFFFYDDNGNLIDSNKYVFNLEGNKILIQKFFEADKNVDLIKIDAYNNNNRIEYKKKLNKKI